MENLIHEINGIKYILMNDIVTTPFTLRITITRIKEIGGIFQGVHEKQTD